MGRVPTENRKMFYNNIFGVNSPLPFNINDNISTNLLDSEVYVDLSDPYVIKTTGNEIVALTLKKTTPIIYPTDTSDILGYAVFRSQSDTIQYTFMSEREGSVED